MTPSRLKRLGKEKQLEYMLFWFRSNFEDPARETPYEGREGGYQYIWGGPYNALEQLGREFGDLVREHRIQEAADEVESDGIFDWAPGDNHPDKRDREREVFEEAFEDDLPFDPDVELETVQRRLAAGVIPQFGGGDELERRAEILKRLDALEAALRRPPRARGGIGHNNPPPDSDLAAESLLSDIAEASRTIRTEITKDRPDVKAVAEATSQIHAGARWFVRNVADGYTKALGAAGAAATIAWLSPQARQLMLDVSSAAIHWLSHVTLPF